MGKHIGLALCKNCRAQWCRLQPVLGGVQVGGCREKWNHGSVCRLQQKRPRLDKSSFSMGLLGSVKGQETFMRVLEGSGAVYWHQKGLGQSQMFCAQWSGDKKNIFLLCLFEGEDGKWIKHSASPVIGTLVMGRSKSGDYKPLSATFFSFIFYIALITAEIRYLFTLLLVQYLAPWLE